MDVGTGCLETQPAAVAERLETQDIFGNLDNVDFIGTSEQDVQSLTYEPSFLPTDFSGDLPFPFDFSDVGLQQSYNVDAVVSSAWHSLRSEDYKMPWETDFWDQFLNPEVTVMEQLSRGFKRPMSAPPVHVAKSSEDVEVDRRVAQKTFPLITSFLQHIKDVPERSWQEERDALWETSIRRWVALLDQWTAEDSLLLQAIQGKNTFTEKAQILVGVFYNKAPQTLIKRANSLNGICSGLRAVGLNFPCTEEAFYSFLKAEASKMAPPSRLKAFFEAAVFSRHVLGLDVLQSIVTSRRCLGAASQRTLCGPKQAAPFTVKQLQRLHDVLRDGDELWDKAMAGMLLFCIYGRSRWADAQHASEIVPDRDDCGELQSIELQTAVHKTTRAFHLRHMFLPISAPAHGVTTDNWALQWLQAREGLRIVDLGFFPLMPAPDRNLEPTKRPISTQEAKLWIRHLLGDLVSSETKLTSHSCKCTCLSFLAKRGVSVEDRLTLGYHSNKMRIALVYSRDAAARPLAILAQVLREIREGIFEPDNTRSGRLKPGVGPIEQAVIGAEGTGPLSAAGRSEPEHADDGHQKQMETSSVLQDAVQSHEPVSEDMEEEGHVTTDSSDSSETEEQAWGPVVGHYEVSLPSDKTLWKNHNSKMFHLSHESYVRVLLCGRRITDSFSRHEGAVRFDAAKCRQCFRLKDS